MTDRTDAIVADQYEAYPYPARDPKDEAKRLVVGSPSHLAEIDHWVFGARRDPARPLNALIAGGGTGDACVMLAAQLARAGRPGQVTWLDRSAAAAAIARRRLEARGLTNVTFVQGSLLDLPSLGLGPFDYIDCCGVLHHLPDPAAGLSALVSVLAPGGGLGLMVYAPHGRTGVYMAQDALRRLAPPDRPLPERVETARRFLRALHPEHWLARNARLNDHIAGGDAGIVDLLLHARDRAYTVPDLLALLDGAGLATAALIEPARYDPATWLADPRLRARAAGLPWAEQAALAEAASGTMAVHIVYVVRAGAGWAAPDPADETRIPVLRELDGAALAAQAGAGGRLSFDLDGVSLPVALPPLGAAILRGIDGRSPLGAVLDGIGAPAERVRRAWAALYAGLNAMNRLLLAAPPGG
ncbi:class I SAM-dependent methyltransferase [Elioraea tepidiphila]|jgi:SAM-dependent methyltransferase|uniref:class I SAM-dependent methyltransferase n=1 Tax=Elioraea tepidiphila TaxID=457934 RepID=UPI0003759943|nr:class I SAM-dependent methyltransferase [Elioraea tepidiphila]